MAYDANLALQAAVTKVATFNGAGIALPQGTPSRGLHARIILTSLSAATATVTVTPSIDYSSDSGTTWSTLASAPPITAGATVVTGERFIGFITPLNAHNNPNAQVRLTMTMTGGTTPSVVYSGDIGTSEP